MVSNTVSNTTGLTGHARRPISLGTSGSAEVRGAHAAGALGPQEAAHAAREQAAKHERHDEREDEVDLGALVQPRVALGLARLEEPHLPRQQRFRRMRRWRRALFEALSLAVAVALTEGLAPAQAPPLAPAPAPTLAVRSAGVARVRR